VCGRGEGDRQRREGEKKDFLNTDKNFLFSFSPCDEKKRNCDEKEAVL